MHYMVKDGRPLVILDSAKGPVLMICKKHNLGTEKSELELNNQLKINSLIFCSLSNSEYILFIYFIQVPI